MPSFEHDGATIHYEVARLLPQCELIREWKTGAALEAARVRVREFLSKHTPAWA
jgi:hypothetical protein